MKRLMQESPQALLDLNKQEEERNKEEDCSMRAVCLHRVLLTSAFIVTATCLHLLYLQFRPHHQQDGPIDLRLDAE